MAELHKTVVLDVVGLTRALISEENTPFLHAYLHGSSGPGKAAEATLQVVEPAFPALTCTAQATYLTGHGPASHGIVGNGW